MSIPTIRLLESGQGNLTTLWTVLHILNLAVVGRNLPPGQHIGERIITLRPTERGESTSACRQLVGVSQPTFHRIFPLHSGERRTISEGYWSSYFIV